MTSKDIVQVVVSDFHTSSNYALFLDREWHGTKEASHIPRGIQLKIRGQFEAYAEEVRQVRKGKQVRLVHNGDAVDGDHHHSGEVCTLNVLDQADIHIELMQDFQKRIGWQRGDEIYYTRGTQTHVNEFENYIGREMNAVPNGDFYVHDLLVLNSNGVTSWFAHHGPKKGDGANEGNAMRNWLKNVHFDAVLDGRPTPHIIYTAHVHTPAYSTFIWRKKMEYFTLHGIILPSWQAKTAYANQVAPVQVNRIGGVYQVIKSDGTVGMPRFCVMDT